MKRAGLGSSSPALHPAHKITFTLFLQANSVKNCFLLQGLLDITPSLLLLDEMYIFLTSVDFNLRSEIPFFRPAIASNCCPSDLKVSNRVKHPVNTLENRNDAGIWSLFRHQGTAFSWIKYQLSGAYENWSLLKRCTQHSILGTYLISQSLIILK